MEDEGLGTHLWVGNHSRRLEVGAKPLVLFRCPLCERDFARAPPIRSGAQCASVRSGSV
jgi:hypothetical protein